MVINHPQDGHPLSPGGSPSTYSLVTHHPKEGRPPSSGWSPTVLRIWLHTIPMMVTHQQYNAHPYPWDGYHFLQGRQLDLEFDSSAAQLVNLVASLAQLVYPSEALPAKACHRTSQNRSTFSGPVHLAADS